MTARPARLSLPQPPPQPAPSSARPPATGAGCYLHTELLTPLRRNINSAPCLFQAERERGPVLVISAAAALLLRSLRGVSQSPVWLHIPLLVSFPFLPFLLLFSAPLLLLSLLLPHTVCTH